MESPAQPLTPADGMEGDDEYDEDEDDARSEIDDGEAESSSDEEEPRLKYQRMAGSMPSLLSNDAASCITVAERMIALGTHDGTVHLLDYQGNQVKEFAAHTATVNELSFDAIGEFIGSCSDDGSVVVNSLYSDEKERFDFHRPMKAVALDPDYEQKSTRRFVAGGLAGQLVLHGKAWFGNREQILHSQEGPIHAIKWRTSLIAWANDVGVKVYDTASNQRLTYIERPRGSPRAELIRPNLVWQDDTYLVIGWGDSVKVAAIRTRRSDKVVPNRNQPYSGSKYVEIVSTFQTQYHISGIAPYEDALVILAYLPEKEAKLPDSPDGVPSRQLHAQRPEVRIVSWKNEELTRDALPIHGYEHYKVKDYFLAHAPFSGSSSAGGQWTDGDEPLYYIVSPKDVVIARPRDADDHVNWLLEHNWHEKALAAVHAGKARKELLDEDTKDTLTNLTISQTVEFIRLSIKRNRGRLQCFQEGDRHRRDLKLKENDCVLLRFEKARLRKKKGKERLYPKLSMRYYGPFQITERINDVSFRLRLPDTWKIHNAFHVSLLKPFRGDVLDDGEVDEQPELEENEEILIPEQILAHKDTKTKGVIADDYNIFKRGVGSRYLDHLILERQYAQAAALCPKLLRGSAAAWERCVFQFAQLRQLPALAPYIPTSNPQLRDTAYEIVLNALITNPAFHKQALSIIKTWPSAIYSVPAITTAIELQLSTSAKSPPLQEALAELYLLNNQYEKALALYVELLQPKVFDFIDEHNLYDSLHDKVLPLMQLDGERAVALLVQHLSGIPPAEVVSQLQRAGTDSKFRHLMHLYLHELFEKDPNAGKDFHGLQVELYAEYEPRLLLPFLRSSHYYSLDKAYDVCTRRSLTRERVFILGRMGNSREALSLIIKQLKDMEEAVEFVAAQHDDDLWEELINQSLSNPQMIGALLELTVGNIDPLHLVSKVPNGMQIPRLRDRLVKIVTDYRTETSLRHGCNNILKADCVNLSVRYLGEARHAIFVGSRDEGTNERAQSVGLSRLPSQGGTPTTMTGGSGKCCICFDPVALQNVSVVAFFCTHVYHVTCLAESSDNTQPDVFNEKDNYLPNGIPAQSLRAYQENGDSHTHESDRSNLRCILCTTAAAASRRKS
ncbi:hypothetical protein L7F22_007249 [Adiantum nelumboides]|nr:hypothetical protein [Adiantum nelumboides]